MARTMRLAVAGDFEHIAAITNHYIRTTVIHFGDQDVTADELRLLWQQHGDLYPWLCVEQDGHVLGYAKAGVWRARSAYRWTPECGIYVHHQHLGKGLGRPLYAWLLRVLAAQGFSSAIGGITLPNASSARLHESLGFQYVGAFRRAGFKFGAWHDVGFWQKDFSDRIPGPIGHAEQVAARVPAT